MQNKKIKASHSDSSRTPRNQNLIFFSSVRRPKSWKYFDCNVIKVAADSGQLKNRCKKVSRGAGRMFLLTQNVHSSDTKLLKLLMRVLSPNKLLKNLNENSRNLLATKFFVQY
jgi:hypothetical protein